VILKIAQRRNPSLAIIFTSLKIISSMWNRNQRLSVVELSRANEKCMAICLSRTKVPASFTTKCDAKRREKPSRDTRILSVLMVRTGQAQIRILFATFGA
jgi:hypothetical protein